MSYRDRNWLYDAYIRQGMSTQQIAQMCGVAQKTIARWLHKHGIPVRSPRERLISMGCRERIDTTDVIKSITIRGGAETGAQIPQEASHN